MAAAFAPSVQAAETFKVTAVAAGSTNAVGTAAGQMLLTVSWAAADPAMIAG